MIGWIVQTDPRADGGFPGSSTWHDQTWSGAGGVLDCWCVGSSRSLQADAFVLELDVGSAPGGCRLNDASALLCIDLKS